MEFVSNEEVSGFLKAVEALTNADAFWEFVDTSRWAEDGAAIGAEPQEVCRQYLATVATCTPIVPPKRQLASGTFTKILAQRLWNAYVYSGLTSWELADATGISETELHLILIAQLKPSSLQLALMAEALKVGTDVLLFLEPTAEEMALETTGD